MSQCSQQLQAAGPMQRPEVDAECRPSKHSKTNLLKASLPKSIFKSLARTVLSWPRASCPEAIWIVPSLACHANHQVELQTVVTPGHVEGTDDDAQPSANAQHHPIHDGRHPAHTGHTANMPTTWLQVRRLCKCQSQNLQVIISMAKSTIAFKCEL